MGCAHNDEYACFDCETAAHRRDHPEYREGCRSCKLGTLRIQGKFTGLASLSPAVDYFNETGDPSVFDRQDRAAAAARADRVTRVESTPER